MAASKKDGKIELLRFLAIAFIMCDHMAQIGLGSLSRPFTGTWIYVEFFLILSGFMTARHFYAGSVEPQDTASGKFSAACTESVKYTIGKYSKFIPYVVCAVLAEFLIKYISYLKAGDFLGFWQKMQDMPFEMLLLSTAGTNGTRLFPIWYLSATFLVNPVVCMIAQIRNKYVKGLIAFYPAVFYYLNKAHGIGSHEYPNQLLRALCGMLLGVFVFLVTEGFSTRKISKCMKWCCTVLAAAAFCALMFVGYQGYRGIDNTYILGFIAIIILVFSNQTYLPRLSNPFLLFLGKISMPMFIWHWVVAHILVLFIPEDQVTARILVYYFGTILVSAASMYCIGAFKNLRKSHRTGSGTGISA